MIISTEAILREWSDGLGGPAGYVPVMLAIALLVRRELWRAWDPELGDPRNDALGLRVATGLLTTAAFVIPAIRLAGLAA